MFRIACCILILGALSAGAAAPGADDAVVRRDGTSVKAAKRKKRAVVPDAADIRYAEKRRELAADDPSSDRLLDVYLPRTGRPRTGFPCVMFIHGGGFRGGDKSSGGNLDPVCRGLLRHGIAVVSINYYLVRKYSGSRRRDRNKEVRIAAEDAELAMKWIAEHAAEYGLDTARFAVCGSSAGARTSMELGFVRHPKTPKIRAVIDLWGIMVDPGKIRRGSPPALIIHGDRDKICDISVAYAIKRRLDDLKIANRMIVMKGKGHSQSREVSRKYLDDVIGFLRTHWDAAR